MKRDTSANWTKENPIILEGEEIFVDTCKGELRSKVGDGKKRYNDLPFTDEKLRSMINDLNINMKNGTSENSLVGNDIDNNQAISAYSTALGNGTIAGSKGFRIIASSGTAGGEGTYTLEGYEGGILSNNILPPPNKKTETITDSNEYAEGYSTYTLNDDGSFHLEWSTPVSLAHRIEFNGLNLEAGKSYVISQSGLRSQVGLSIEYNNASHYLN